jgi:hypothetical protein
VTLAPADQKSIDTPSECLVLVSDTSAEAERLIASLRVRGFKVRDVPLMLLAGRVEAQRPRLVICDGQAEGVVQALTRMRQGNCGAKVELLLLGADPRLNEALSPLVPEIESRTFVRPIDVYSVLQRVEEVIHLDLSSRPGSRSMAALPRVGVSSAAAADRAPTPPLRRGRSSISNPPMRLSAMAAAARGEVLAPPANKPNSVAPPSENSVPDSQMPVVPVARMSPELEQLLSDADRRLATGPMSLQPISLPSSRLTPDQELDAILPPDVLAALEDPVDFDEEDETSHPAGRHRERSSSVSPHGKSATASEVPPVLAEAGEGFSAAGTFPVAADTPVGRADWRGRVSAGDGDGSDPSRESAQGSVLTPVPASVKTHHTHHTQANSSPIAASVDAVEHAPERELSQTPHHEAERRRHLDGDSVAPGTNPEMDAVGSQRGAPEGPALDRELMATVPPHPIRHDAKTLGQLWGTLDDSVPSQRYASRPSEVSPPTVTNRREGAHSTSTNPPGKVSRRVSTAEPAAVSPAANLPAPESVVSPENRDEIPQEGPPSGGRASLEVPAALGPGDVVRALSRCVRSRYSGALAIEDDSGIRRVVMREGDFVMVASGLDDESLVAFLIQRGDLDSDAARLARKLPQFGRHAGAALIAHGYLRQDELWPVLRAHAEWLLGRAIGVSQGSSGLESELPARLAGEPAVFGGATGAEILIEIVRRIVPPEVAIETLGGRRARAARGPASRLLSECALTPSEAQIVERAAGLTIEELLSAARNADFASALYAMVELGVLSTMAPTQEASRDERQSLDRDGLDDAAVRGRVAIRRGLVDEGDYFALLGISRDATGYEVRHAYLDLRREFDPSRMLTASTANLREDVDLVLEVLDEAYEILRDSARRERYRRALEAAPTPEG